MGKSTRTAGTSRHSCCFTHRLVAILRSQIIDTHAGMRFSARGMHMGPPQHTHRPHFITHLPRRAPGRGSAKKSLLVVHYWTGLFFRKWNRTLLDKGGRLAVYSLSACFLLPYETQCGPSLIHQIQRINSTRIGRNQKNHHCYVSTSFSKFSCWARQGKFLLDPRGVLRVWLMGDEISENLNYKLLMGSFLLGGCLPSKSCKISWASLMPAIQMLWVCDAQ
jgi:hypothetical protein